MHHKISRNYKCVLLQQNPTESLYMLSNSFLSFDIGNRRRYIITALVHCCFTCKLRSVSSQGTKPRKL
jgi:hypothetical protein